MQCIDKLYIFANSINLIYKDMEVKNLAGRPLKYTPEEIEAKFWDYVDNNENRVFYKSELIKSGDRAGEIISVPVRRPLSVVGFCVYAKILKSTFYELLENKDKGFSDTLRTCKEYIEADQIEGAASGLLNPMIISRLNGLTEKVEANITSDKITIDLNNNNIDLSK